MLFALDRHKPINSSAARSGCRRLCQHGLQCLLCLLWLLPSRCWLRSLRLLLRLLLRLRLGTLLRQGLHGGPRGRRSGDCPSRRIGSAAERCSRVFCLRRTKTRGFPVHDRNMLTNRDDVAASLAADLQNLALHFFVPDGVPGLTTLAGELHCYLYPQRQTSNPP